MRKLSLIALASITLAGCQSDKFVGPAQNPAPPTSAVSDNGSYIVVMKPTTSQFAASSMQSMVAASGATVEHTYTQVFNGFSAHMTPEAAEGLRQRADVQLVEPDALVSIVGTQNNAPWSLDRLDQTALPLNGTYTTSTTGAGVSAYILDTGIRASHSEFGGRATAAFSALAGTADDCNGHGTHVAGIIGGSTYGVAKSIKLYGVRVLDCDGSGRISGVIAGIDWITANAKRPAVANMSLGGGVSGALDNAVKNAIAAGITFAIAAGNSSGDACNESPARVPAALTVAAVGSDDARAGWSNYGACVDIFAPGVDVTSAWNGSDSDVRTASGTSMASPHVAGVAALYLENHPSALPAEVASALNAAAGVDLVQDAVGSANRLLSTVRDGVVVPPTPVDNPPVAKFTASCVLLVCTVDAGASTDDGTITLYNWSMPGAIVSAAIGSKASPVYLTAGVKSITLTVTDNSGKTNSITQTVTIAPINQAPVAQFSSTCAFLACSFDGTSSSDDNGIADYSWSWTGPSESGTATGATANFTFPRTGGYSVVLTVRDASGLTNSVTHSVTATAQNQSPSAAITAPNNGLSAVQGTSITFTGAGTDPEDGTLGGTSLVWTSSINGAIGTGASFATTALSVGSHVITLTVKDAQGVTATATRNITITAPNQLPSASITQPGNNASAEVGTIIVFIGAGTDAEDGTLGGTSLTWSSSINGVIGTGTTFNTGSLSIGTHTITLTVKDAQGATASTTTKLNITATPNKAPSASITAPNNGLSVVQGTSVTFSGSGNDTEDGTLSGASLTWTSSINGAIGSGTSFSTSALSVGAHVITLTAKDAQGLTATSTRNITVTAPNQAPTASILQPTNNASAEIATIIVFVGAGTDPEDGPLGGTSMVWSSNLDGVIGTGTSFNAGSLSVGTHTITLTVKDSQGAASSATTKLVITPAPIPNRAPSASITSPNIGLSVVQGTSISFAGSGNDPEDGTLSGASLAWTSSINGTIGSGTSFTTSALSVGVHTITLTAKDAQGLTATSTRNVTVTAPNQLPTASILQPSNNASAEVSTVIMFVGAGTDPEDGPLSGSSMVWSSNIDGVFGTGVSVNTGSLSIGTHTITLTVKDAAGASATTTSKLVITPAPIPNRAPLASISSPTNGSTAIEGTSVTLVGSGTDVEDGSLNGSSLSWSSSRDGNLGTGASLNVSSLSVGTHVITLTAKDSQGLTGVSMTTITINSAPVVEPPPPTTPEPVAPVANFTVLCPTSGITRYCRFDASSSSDADGITGYSWTYGDGRSEAQAAVAKTIVYPRGGSYEVTLTVTNKAGVSATTSKTITLH